MVVIEREGELDFGHIRAKVSFLSQYKRRPRSEKEAAKKGIVAKKNISHFYSELYAAIFGGKVGPVYKGDVEKLAGGKSVNFHPDIVSLTRQGRIYTEVKCSSARGLQYLCAVDQAANYCLKLLQSLERGDINPGVNYAFFKYGVRDDFDWKKLSNEKLEKRLCEVRSLVIVPLNLALLLFLNAPRISKNQTTSNSNKDQQEYFRLNGGSFTCLARSRKELEEIADNYFSVFGGELKAEDLFLDDLQLRRFESPEIVVNGHHKIKPFGIARYSLPNGKYCEWLEHFKQEHERILQVMKVPDLYAQHQKALEHVPF